MAIAPLQIPQANINSSADFSPLAGLGETYKKAQNERKLSDLGKQLASGSIDYRSAAGQVADMGDINSTLKFLALAEQQRKEGLGQAASERFSGNLAGLYGGGAAQTIAAPPSAGVDPAPGLMPDPAVSTPRAPVASSPTTWGDQEAEAAGLYEPKPGAQAALPLAAPTAPAEPAPSFGDRFAAARPQGVAPAQISPAAAQVQPALSRLPPAARMQVITRAMTDQYLPADQKEVAKELFKRELDEMKTPDRIRVLQAFKADANDPRPLIEIEKDLHRSGASKTDINLGDKKYAETVDKDLGEEFVNIQKQGRAASNTQGTLDLLERAVKTPGFDSGTLPALTTAVKRGLVSLGVADADSALPNEVFDKLSNKLVLDLSGGKLGTGFSNADREFMQMTTANRQNTPEGNLAIINIQRKITEREREVAQMARDYAREHKGKIDYDFYETLDKYAKANPLFDEVTAPAGAAAGAAAPPRLTTPDEYSKLKSGMQFVDPEGNLRTKP